jgi:thymidylate synthase (FAD)
MHRVTPQVFLIGESELNEGAGDYLQHIGTKWRPSYANPHDSSCEDLTEFMGRLCYRSWEPGMNPNVTKIRADQKEYIGNILKSKHGSVLEHAVTHWVFADVSRVFTHELVRHRAGMAFSQESLRFVRLEDLGLWLPPEIEADPEAVKIFEETFTSLGQLQIRLAEHFKLDELKFTEKKGYTSAMRRVAPIGLATTIGASFNFRALRHVATMRSPKGAEAEIRLVVDQLMAYCMLRWPTIFQDFTKNAAGEWIPKYEKI